MFEGKDEIRVAVVAGGSVQPCTLAGSDAWRVVVGGGGLHTRLAGSGTSTATGAQRGPPRGLLVLTSQCAPRETEVSGADCDDD